MLWIAIPSCDRRSRLAPDSRPRADSARSKKTKNTNPDPVKVQTCKRLTGTAKGMPLNYRLLYYLVNTAVVRPQRGADER